MLKELWNSEEVIKLRNDYKEYIVTDEKLNGVDVDKDRCPYVWDNLYIPLYSKTDFWSDTKLKEYGERAERKGVTKKEYEIFYSSLINRISGDVLFSFKAGLKTKQKQKYEHYVRLINDEKDFTDEEKRFYLEVLKFCNDMNYSFHNLGLMPVDGNLQSFKERQCNRDRMDRFVYFVAEYLDGKDHFVLTSNFRDKEKREEKRREDKKTLEEFFSVFNRDVYKYCEEMYLITDRKYVDDLKEFGESEIICGRDVVRYMELAIRYWIIKDKILNQ